MTKLFILIVMIGELDVPRKRLLNDSAELNAASDKTCKPITKSEDSIPT